MYELGVLQNALLSNQPATELQNGKTTHAYFIDVQRRHYLRLYPFAHGQYTK